MVSLRSQGITSLRKALLPAAAGACLAVSATTSAGAWEITFDESFINLSGQIIDDEYSTPGLIDPGASDFDPALTATFSALGVHDGSNANVSQPAIVFDSNNPTGGDPDLGAPFTPGPNNPSNQNLSPGNILILHEHPQDCNGTSCTDPDDIGARPAGRFIIEFNKAVELQSIDFFDVETPESGPGPDNQILLFDMAGNQILPNTPFYTPDTGGDNKWDVVNFNVVGVKKIEVRMAGSGALDNIRGTNIPNVTQVAEPEMIALFGLSLLGLAMWRRRKMAVATA